MSNDSKLITVYIPKNKAEQVVEWFDSSPLTDETLKELGFEDMCGGNDNAHHIYTVDSFRLFSNSYRLFSYPILLDNGYYIVKLGLYNDETPEWKTVGGVKLLIEALKGDE